MIAAPQHEYTRNLFASVPAVDLRPDRLPVFDDEEDNT